MTNQEIAAVLEGTARLLELQETDPLRVRSYRTAADYLRQLDEPIANIYRQAGETGLRQLKGVTETVAPLLSEILDTGGLGLRDRLERELSPETSVCPAPEIGEELAERVRDELGAQANGLDHGSSSRKQAEHAGKQGGPDDRPDDRERMAAERNREDLRKPQRTSQPSSQQGSNEA